MAITGTVATATPVAPTSMRASWPPLASICFGAAGPVAAPPTSSSTGLVTLNSGTIDGGGLLSNAGYEVKSGSASAQTGAVGLTETTADTVVLTGANPCTAARSKPVRCSWAKRHNANGTDARTTGRSCLRVRQPLATPGRRGCRLLWPTVTSTVGIQWLGPQSLAPPVLTTWR